MNAYEFTRFDADFTAKAKAGAYDIRTLAFLIDYHDKEKALRQSGDYADCKETFIELTMSCTEEEAKRWMEYWMANAIAYGLETQNRDWRTKFLAAYDIYRGNFQ